MRLRAENMCCFTTGDQDGELIFDRQMISRVRVCFARPNIVGPDADIVYPEI